MAEFTHTWAPRPVKNVYACRILALCAALFVSQSVMTVVLWLVAGFFMDLAMERYFLPRMRRQSLQQQVSVMVVALFAKMCKAKGHVTKEDIRLVRQSLRGRVTDLALVSGVFNQARVTTQGFDRLASQIAAIQGNFPSDMEVIVRILYRIALQDGVVDSNEKVFILRVAEIFGIAPMRLKTIEREMGLEETAEQAYTYREEAEQKWQRQQSPPPKPAGPDPLKVLGLKDGVSMAEIKAAYRKLVMKHHPDRLRGQGAKEADILKAEARMAEVNAAYNQLTGKK